jgi:predicted phage terminase large subunit-like protein
MVSRFIDEKAAAVIVQQRLNESDLTGHLLAQDEGWHHLCLPAEYVPSHPFTYPDKVKLPSGKVLSGDPRTVAGELLDPVRLSDDQLKGPRSRPWVFAGQYQQQPAPVGGGLFEKDWYSRRWQPGFDTRGLSLRGGWDRKIQSWDMAFKDTKGSDFVVGQLWGLHGADAYLLAQVRGRFDFTTTCHVVQALTDFDPAAVAKLVEDKANGTAVINTLRRKIGGLIPVQPQGSKYARAAAVAPLHESRNIILPAANTIPCPSHYVDADGQRHELTPTTVADWIHEHTVFPAGANDDQVDAMSQALTWANPQESEREPDMPGTGPAETVMSGVMDMRF